MTWTLNVRYLNKGITPLKIQSRAFMDQQWCGCHVDESTWVCCHTCVLISSSSHQQEQQLVKHRQWEHDAGLGGFNRWKTCNERERNTDRIYQFETNFNDENVQVNDWKLIKASLLWFLIISTQRTTLVVLIRAEKSLCWFKKLYLLNWYSSLHSWCLCCVSVKLNVNSLRPSPPVRGSFLKLIFFPFV